MTARIAEDVTLIMTVLNEADTLGVFLASLETQTRLPRRIVIVDGGSTDGTPSVIEAWDAPEGVVVSVIVSPGANISEGRNTAIAAVETTWVAVTDAGTTLDPRWLEHLSDAMSDDVDVVSGWFEPLRGSTALASTIAAVITPLRSEIDAEAFLPSSRSIAFRKQAWLTAGGYPEWLDYCEDLVYDMTLKAGGRRFAFADRAIVAWDARPTLSAFFKQYYRYARGDGKAGLWAKRHIARYSAYTVGAALLATALTRRSPLAALTLTAAAGAYLWKSFRRVNARRPSLIDSAVQAWALTPVIVVTGDLAKMAGYPAGLRWRALRARDARSGQTDDHR